MELFYPLCMLLIFVIVQPALPTILKLERFVPQGANITKLRHMDQERHQPLTFPLVGSVNFNSYGLYFTRVKLGSPPREYSLQVDTGSDISWVSCSPCNGCPTSSGFGIPLTLYNPRSSSSASQVFCSDRACWSGSHLNKLTCSRTASCTYKLRYGDQSLCTGNLVRDLLHFNTDTGLGGSVTTNSSVPIIFGCSYNLSGRLSRPDMALDGILGLGLYHPSIIPQLSSYGTPKVFSHCLRGDDGGGTLVVGEIQEAGVIYTPLVPHAPHYNVKLESIAISGEKVPIDPVVFTLEGRGGTIVDSGTTLGILAPEAFDAFINSFTAALTRYGQSVTIDADLCFQVSSRTSDVLPNVSFNFKGGASMILKPENYLRWITRFKDVHTWCLGFQRAQGRPITVLGDIVLKNKLIVYDLERQRLGWMDFDCSRPVNASLKPYRSASSLSTDSLFKSIVISTTAFFIYVSLFV